MLKVSDEFRQQMSKGLAKPMYCLSLAFLIVVAIMLVLWVDVPFFMAPPGGDAVGDSSAEIPKNIVTWISFDTAVDSGYHCLLLLVLMWPWFLLESIFQILLRDRD